MKLTKMRINLRFLSQIHDTFKCEKTLWKLIFHLKQLDLASSADFSLMNLFIRADIIVKSVIIILNCMFNLFMGSNY